MQLIFATNNAHKITEMQTAIGHAFELTGLKDAGIDIDIPEPHDTLEENAAEKSWTIYRKFGINCFSEDTGLEVFALNGEPGVKSARYAGDNREAGSNIEKLLSKLTGINNREARFRTIISLIIEGKEFRFEGICTGSITSQPVGEGGFGYDAVFIPNGAVQTFAEMSLPEKNEYSHRRKAADKLVQFLRQLKP